MQHEGAGPFGDDGFHAKPWNLNTAHQTARSRLPASRLGDLSLG